jgi:hypothetical protein
MSIQRTKSRCSDAVFALVLAILRREVINMEIRNRKKRHGGRKGKR